MERNREKQGDLFRGINAGDLLHLENSIQFFGNQGNMYYAN